MAPDFLDQGTPGLIATNLYFWKEYTHNEKILHEDTIEQGAYWN